MYLPTATLSTDQSNHSPGFLNFQLTNITTWLWRWLPHRLSKRQSLTTVLLRTPITQMIFFNQVIWIKLAKYSPKAFFNISFQDTHCINTHRTKYNKSTMVKSNVKCCHFPPFLGTALRSRRGRNISRHHMRAARKRYTLAKPETGKTALQQRLLWELGDMLKACAVVLEHMHLLLNA